MSSLAVYTIIIMVVVCTIAILILIAYFQGKKIKKLKKENSNLYESINRLKDNIELLEKHNKKIDKLVRETMANEKDIKSAKTKEDRDSNMDMLNNLNNKL